MDLQATSPLLTQYPWWSLIVWFPKISYFSLVYFTMMTFLFMALEMLLDFDTYTQNTHQV